VVVSVHVSVDVENLQVAVHVRTVLIHLAVHLVAFPRLLLTTVRDTVLGAPTHCHTHTHTRTYITRPHLSHPSDPLSRPLYGAGWVRIFLETIFRHSAIYGLCVENKG